MVDEGDTGFNRVKSIIALSVDINVDYWSLLPFWIFRNEH